MLNPCVKNWKDQITEGEVHDSTFLGSYLTVRQVKSTNEWRGETKGRYLVWLVKNDTHRWDFPEKAVFWAGLEGRIKVWEGGSRGTTQVEAIKARKESLLEGHHALLSAETHLRSLSFVSSQHDTVLTSWTSLTTQFPCPFLQRKHQVSFGKPHLSPNPLKQLGYG